MTVSKTLMDGDGFRLYRTYGDDNHVCLQLDGVSFSCSNNGLTVIIPAWQWEALRKQGGIDFSLADKTDEAIRAECEDFVRQRQELAKSAEEKGAVRTLSLAGVCGRTTYGGMELTAEEQVANGVESLTRRRDELRELREKVKAAEEGFFG